MGNGLQAEYEALVRKAAAYGFTSVRGHTPREHLARLLEAGPWLEADLRRLTEMVEGGVFAGSPEMAAEGVEICRRLAAELPNLPPPTGKTSRPASRFVFPIPPRAVLLILLAAAIVAGTFWLPKLGPGSVGGRSGLQSRGRSPWTSEREKSSIRSLTKRWNSPPNTPTFETVDVPEWQAPGELSSATGFTLATGIDHHYRNVKEPFDPPLSHHHRQFVYSWIDRSGRFRMVRSPLRPALVPEAPEGARLHRADVKLRLEAGNAVPIPVPAPDSLVVSFEPIDGVELRFVKDPADGLRVWSNRNGAFRLRYVTATVSDYRFARLPAVPLSEVSQRPIPLPPDLRREAQIVLDHIGLPADGTWEERVRILHAYFAGFSVSRLQPSEFRGSRYLTIALARKGTCGNRALAFAITANAAGIPARLVTNDIHAFGEVQMPDGTWRAIELRLLDGERNYPLQTLGSLEGAGIVFGLLAFTIAVMALWALSARRPAPVLLATEDHGSRAQRRAERDVARGLSGHVLLRLVGATLDRVARTREVPVQDRRALRLALREEDHPPPLRIAMTALLDLEETVSPGSRIDRYRLREAYWSARKVLEWLEKGQEP